MKNLLPALFILLSLFATAQEKASFEIHFSPNYTNIANPITDGNGKFGYHIGFNFSNSLKEGHIDWLIGLQLSNFSNSHTKTFISLSNLHFEDHLLDTFPDINIDILAVKDSYIKNNYYYMDLPLGIRYHLLRKKVKLFIQATLSPSVFLVRRTRTTKVYDNKKDSVMLHTNRDSDIRNLNIFGGFGVGLQIPINHKIGINLQSQSGIHVLPSSKDDLNKSRFYSVGFGVSLVYHLH